MYLVLTTVSIVTVAIKKIKRKQRLFSSVRVRVSHGATQHHDIN